MKNNNDPKNFNLDRTLIEGLEYKSPDISIDTEAIDRKHKMIGKIKYLPIITLGLANIYGLFLPNGINSFTISKDMNFVFSNSTLLTITVGLFLIYCYAVYTNKTVKR